MALDQTKDIDDLIVVGGGAAGFFAAINCGRTAPGAKIRIVEKSTKLLSKVAISGGGRCNVTYNCREPHKLSDHYPRGSKFLRRIFPAFDAVAMLHWLESRDVAWKAEADGRIFPATDSSQTIIECFLNEALNLKIKIEMQCPVDTILRGADGAFVVRSGNRVWRSRYVVVAPGGNPNPNFYLFLTDLGLKVKPPMPSLFTFNDPGKQFADLMGVAVPDAQVRIAGTRFVSHGPVLITHWGLSGPGVIRLSAWAAEYLHSVQYVFTVMVNWTGTETEESIRRIFLHLREQKPRQKIFTRPFSEVPARLWERLCSMAEIPETKVWGEISNKQMNRLLENSIRCTFHIKGKTTFKDEFVTCGGVHLDEIEPSTMESKRIPGLFLAGEVLDIDGETGGFNFQAAWTTAYLAARTIADRLRQAETA